VSLEATVKRKSPDVSFLKKDAKDPRKPMKTIASSFASDREGEGLDFDGVEAGL